MDKAEIVVQNGELKERVYSISRRLTIGRHPDNDVQLMNRSTSRFHAEVFVYDDGYWLKDLQSKTGTHVGGKREARVRLEPGDEIKIGETLLRFMQKDVALEPRNTRRTNVSFNIQDTVMLAEMAATEGAEPESGDAGVSEKLENLKKRYNLLYSTTQLMGGDAPQEQVYQEILSQLFSVVSADRGVIMIRVGGAEDLTPVAAKARDPEVDVSHFNVSQTIVDKAMEQRISILTSDAMSDAQFAKGESIYAQNIRSAICAPLLYRGEVLGVIYLDTQRTAHAFSQEALQLVTAIASSSAVAVKNATYIEELKAKSEEIQQSYLNTIKVVANAIEARDKYTLGHAWRVTRFAMAMADHLKWDPDKKEVLEQGGLLHDVGKVGVRDAILCKKGRLSDEEFLMMRLHPEIGSRILKDVPFLRAAIPCVKYHHERWDGKGYPDGLSGEAIPIEGRLLCIVDTFDAMTSNRVYRKGMSQEKAVAEIERCSGSQFDPELVQVFAEVFKSGKVDYILQNKALEATRHVLCPVCSTYLSLDDEMVSGSDIICPICHQRLRLDKSDEGEFLALLS